MKRLWIGVGILVILVAAGVWSMERMEDIYGDIAGELTQAADVLEDGDWQRADGLLRSAGENWEKNWKFTAAMADHNTLDEIDAGFAQMEVYRLNRAAVPCAAACAHLAQQIAALEEAYDLTWWNLL